MTGIILAIIWTFIVMHIDVNSDYKRIESNAINHNRGTWLRILGLIPSFGCLYFPLHSLNEWHIAAKVAIVSGILFSYYWEFFDGWLNLKRGYSWRFNGSDDPSDAKTDNFLQKYTPIQQALIKWGLITIFTILYIIIQKTNYE